MPLIKDGLLIEDSWTAVADDEPLGPDVDPIVSLERWQAEREDLLRRGGPLGLRLRSDQSPERIADDLRHFDLIALEFPKFTDGRAYSYARLLRDRCGFEGELRREAEIDVVPPRDGPRLVVDDFETAFRAPVDPVRDRAQDEGAFRTFDG